MNFYEDVKKQIEWLSYHFRNGGSIHHLMVSVSNIEKEIEFAYRYDLLHPDIVENLHDELLDVVNSICSNITSTKG